ncbi:MULTISPECIES: DUF1641 domain-containing protein [Methylosinus]|uniref:DUF1641 domain-containing protein n=1 Tax=Methylosinus trichosporium (strain ATCC 35070 / NCIMB 11131 / UNIQEM 75 / OB3b) TaxID=595536 RepID=A0A2D2D173_METT3|nr:MULTISPECIES: DUF1641 domain-containing protein [Methylosinus]ATQ68748.1 DUF1641 domain-containing protein [Methylosinus trichosporium OB3b]OBS53092.1 hypothetical protein A8B73_07205 [Methylosinus sp. 3S-1]
MNATNLQAAPVERATRMSDETARGVSELLEKASPLLQGRRFHNIVDLLSLVSDGVDMADDAMIEKLMKAYEEAIGAAWTLGNAARFAANEAATKPTPSLIGLLRTAGDEDVRRGLHFALLFLAALGRGQRDDAEA